MKSEVLQNGFEDISDLGPSTTKVYSNILKSEKPQNLKYSVHVCQKSTSGGIPQPQSTLFDERDLSLGAGAQSLERAYRLTSELQG